jgi:hypothetical protein
MCSNPTFSYIFYFLEVDKDIGPAGAFVPGSSALTPSSGTLSTGRISSTENPTASVVAAAGTLILIISSAFGSLFTIDHALSRKSMANGRGNSAKNAASVGFQQSLLFQCASAVDPVSVLLHFQFLSFSGFLSLDYPLNYLGFTFNFAWANLVFPYPPFEKAANWMSSRSCWKAGSDQVSPGGFETLAARYGLPVQDLGGMVYICAVTGVGITLAFCALVGVILSLLEIATRGSDRNVTIEHLQKRWSGTSSNMILRLVSSLPLNWSICYYFIP